MLALKEKKPNEELPTGERTGYSTYDSYLWLAGNHESPESMRADRKSPIAK